MGKAARDAMMHVYRVGWALVLASGKRHIVLYGDKAWYTSEEAALRSSEISKSSKVLTKGLSHSALQALRNASIFNMSRSTFIAIQHI